MKKINVKGGLSISKSKITTLQNDYLQQIKGGRGLQLARARTKGPSCSCDSHSCNTSLKPVKSDGNQTLS